MKSSNSGRLAGPMRRDDGKVIGHLGHLDDFDRFQQQLARAVLDADGA